MLDLVSLSSTHSIQQKLAINNHLEFYGIDTNELKELSDSKYLENVIIGVNYQIKAIERMNVSLNERLLLNKDAIINAQNIEKSCKKNSIYFAFDNFFIDSSLKNKKIQENLRHEQEKYNEKVKELDNSIAENKLLKIKIEVYELKQKEIDSLNSEIQILKENILQSEIIRDGYRKEHETVIDNFQTSSSLYEEQILEISEENYKLNSIINDLKSIIHQLEQRNSELQSEIKFILSEKEAASAKLLAFTILENHFECDNNSDFISKNLIPNESISKIIYEKDHILNLSEQNNKLIKELQVLQQKFKSLQEESNNHENALKLIGINNMISNTNNKCSSIINLEVDTNAFYEELKAIKSITIDLEKKFYQESQKILQQFNRKANTHLNLHRLIPKILKAMFEKNSELYLLRNLVLDAQREKKVYIPVRNDPIDVCMAEYINSRNPPLALPIVREDQGIYLFSSKTIKVKTENNRIIVRLGGGFEGIEDFVNTNMPPELDRIEERRKMGAAEILKGVFDQDLSNLSISPIFDIPKPPTSDSLNNSISNQRNVSPVRKKKMKECVKSLVRKKTVS